MKIASATLQMESSHNKQQKHEVRESQRVRIGNRSDSAANQRAALVATTSSVQLSASGQSLQSSEAGSIQDSIDAAENDPKLRMIRAMIAMMTGREVKVYHPSAAPSGAAAPAVPTPSQTTPASATTQTQTAPQSTVPAFEYTRSESYSESEQTSFSATGVVHTADGQQINFSLSLSMSRSYYEESNTRITIGGAPQTQDPLVLNFDGKAAQLTDQRFAFDLNSDGKSENINFVAGGSGFLALDRNGDGKINNGSELFGAKSGNGFAELASLDSDHNGWIDENDVAYAQLRVWTKDSNGTDQLTTLKQADVGAIALDRVATSFDIKDANNDLQGKIRSSGVFLHEDGQVGTVQQIDLTV